MVVYSESIGSTMVSASSSWIERSFVSDARLRVRERYRRPRSEQDDRRVIIPDATAWRRYFGLWKQWLDDGSFDLVLLESVAEELDYKLEGVVPRERTTLQKYAQAGDLRCYPDLSFADDEDEFDLWDYPSLPILDRCRWALLRASRLFSDALIISDDPELRSDVSLPIYSADKLLVHLGLADDEHVRNLIRHSDEEYQRRMKTSANPEGYLELDTWTDDRIQSGLKDGSLTRGRLQISTSRHGTVGSYYIPDLRFCFPNDLVVVEPLPPEDWGHPEDSDLVVPSARIVAALELAPRTCVATYIEEPLDATASFALVVPMDARLPKLRARRAHLPMSKRLWMQVDDPWNALDSQYPHARCLRVLGDIGDLETEVECVLRNCQVDLDPWSTQALSELPSELPVIDDSRRDLRTSRRIFSVDPPGCQDIDDTMHAIELENGDIECA